MYWVRKHWKHLYIKDFTMTLYVEKMVGLRMSSLVNVSMMWQCAHLNIVHDFVYTYLTSKRPKQISSTASSRLTFVESLVMHSQFGVRPLLDLFCSSHVPLLFRFFPPVVPLMCFCSASLVPLFASSSTLPLPFNWKFWEDLKMPYRGMLLSLCCFS